MPTVLRVGRFRVVIFLPPREHGPPHVHVRCAGGEVVIALAVYGKSQTIREVYGMRATDVIEAYWIVEEHTAYLMQCWRRHHG